MGQFGAVETPMEAAPDRQSAAVPAESSGVAVEAAPERDSWRHRTWIRAIDFARQYDLFGLDRVPINLSQRDDPNHSHTWNHRVAPTGGPGRYLCTICGAIRRDSRG